MSKRKYKDEQILVFKGDKDCAARKGAKAIVTGYSCNNRFVQVKWLDKLSKEQRDGGYNEEQFERFEEKNMTYGDKLKEKVAKIDSMTVHDCREVLNKTSWKIHDIENVSLPALIALKGGLEYGLNLALKLAKEAKIDGVVI